MVRMLNVGCSFTTYSNLLPIFKYLITEIGLLIYLWLMSQCTECETKFEYDRSQQELTKFLNLEKTILELGSECINAVINLKENLRSREFKLANYIRMEMRNCMDACTTSPVESNNNAIKHGSFAVHCNMNLDKATQRMLNGFNSRLRRRKNRACRAVNKTNRASRAPTKKHIIQKGQGLIDRNYDEREHFKSA
jgi:hypothetical protein